MLLAGWQEGHLEWCGTGTVICLERSANDLHMVQLMATATSSSLATIKSRMV